MHSSQLVAVLVLVGFPAPFVVLLQRRAKLGDRDRALEGVIDRISLGYAIAFAGLFALAQLRLWLFVPFWIVAALAAAFLRPKPPAVLHPAATASAPAPDEDRDRARATPRLLRIDSVLLLSASIYLGLRCLPFLVRLAPIGWDAYFHMTISESIVERGRAVHDWLPYEDIPLNYPIGSHLLLALTQWLSGVRPHRFFELLTVLFTCLTGLQLFSLGSRATQDRRVGCYTALAYLFLANLGSLSYTLWSGLPNLIGMYLFLGLLSALAVEESSRLRSTAVFCAYFLAACFVHHHVMLTSGLCLVWTACFLWFTGERERSKRIAIGLVASGLIGSPYFLMYLLRSVTLGSTDVGDYLEPAENAWGISEWAGLGFTLAVVVGVYLYFKNREQVSAVVIQPLVAMLLVYIGDEFVLRTLSATLFHHEIAPFTSSRFITDAVTLLSVFAGICFRTMEGELEHPAHRFAIVSMIMCGFFFCNRQAYRDTFDRDLPRAREATYEWIREHSAPEVGLIDKDLHATYFTRRMSSSFPLPISEYRSEAANRHALEAVAAGRKKAKERFGRPIWAVVEPNGRAPAGEILFEHSGFRVVDVSTHKPERTASAR